VKGHDVIMTPRKDAARTSVHQRNKVEPLKDEVYRQMFRLEASRPGADMGLAIALLRAWIITASEPGSRSSREWLKKISPICLLMIESAHHAIGACKGSST
jgi:hypothetical protein